MGAPIGLRRRELAGGCIVGVLLVLTGSLARCAGAQATTELRGRAAIRFNGTSTLHDFSGRGEASEFTLRLNGNQHWDADVAVPIAGLNTDNGWRDDGMRDMLHAEECPVIRGQFSDIDPAVVQADGSLSFALTICQVTRPIVARVSKWEQTAAAARFTAEFDVSLEAFGLEAPRTFFMKVGDTVRLTVQATVRRG